MAPVAAEDGGTLEPRGDPGGRKPPSAYATRILLASLSASVAETATFPIDTIKTRLQLQGRRGGALRVAMDIWGGEGSRGLRGFYRGLPPAVVRHVFYTPIRIVGYEHLRSGALPFPADSILGKAFCGGVSGVVAQMIASPADLIKVRMQADGRLVNQGLQPRYAGMVDAVRKIVSAEGIHGLWKGVFPNAQRAFLVNMGELSCYDQAKHVIISNQICDDNMYAHTLASIMSGLAATSLSCPADVVKTRMMNRVLDKHNMPMYRNSFDCVVRTVRFEGIMALWKGFFPTWARLGPWQFVFWVSYEEFRYVAGLSSF